jgi:hypothetical protein
MYVCLCVCVCVFSSYKPNDGLFKPQHVSHFTLYYELYRSTWKKKYICNSVFCFKWEFIVALENVSSSSINTAVSTLTCLSRFWRLWWDMSFPFLKLNL